MKKIYYLPFVAGFTLLGSCSNEAPDVVQGEEIESGDGYYMKVAFNALQTRAASTDPELQIENAAFVFYNQQGRRIATRYIGGAQGNNETADINWVNESDHPASKCAVLKLSSAPKYVSCVVNANDNWTFAGATYENFSALTGNTYKKNGSNVMIMSSTRYYEENDGAIGNQVYLVEIIREKMLHTTPEAAAAAQGDAAVIIPVEPVAAKVTVTNGLELDENGAVNPQEGERVDQVDAVVSFVPELAFLTATNTERYTVKRLPAYSQIPEDVRTKWTVKVNEYGNKRSNWVGETAGSVVWPTLGSMITKDAEDPNNVTVHAGYKYSENPVFYPFDNIDDEAVMTTNVVVAGRYKLTDTAGNNLAAADGSFWLVAIGDKFKVYKTEAEAIAAMGGVSGDTLEEDRENPDSHLTWNGWMRIKGKSYLPKCMKYNGGYGYYSKAIPRAVINGMEYPAIVRNTKYDLTIKTINGMGIGIPTDDTEIIPLDPNDPKDENYYLHIAVDVKEWKEMKYTAEWL